MNNILALHLIAYNRFNINNLPSNQSICCIELFDLTGIKVMMIKEYDGFLDICILDQGIYFIRIKTDAGDVFTGKVVKN
jgi:hypothetical protein